MRVEMVIYEILSLLIFLWLWFHEFFKNDFLQFQNPALPVILAVYPGYKKHNNNPKTKFSKPTTKMLFDLNPEDDLLIIMILIGENVVNHSSWTRKINLWLYKQKIMLLNVLYFILLILNILTDLKECEAKNQPKGPNHLLLWWQISVKTKQTFFI